MSSHLLALETSGARCGVALLIHDGSQLHIVARHHDGVSEHSARLLPLVDEVLAEAGIVRSQLDGIAFGQGPGAFTGLRVACGVAQGIGFALDLPLVPVITHAVMEQQVAHQAPAWRLVVQDARMAEAYVAVLRRSPGGASIQAGPLLLPQGAVASWLTDWLGRQSSEAAAAPPPAGTDWLCLSDLPPEALAAQLAAARKVGVAITAHPHAVQPTAAAVAEVAWQHWLAGVRVAPAEASPVYVRNKVAFTIAERAGGAGGNPRAQVPASA